MLRGPSRSAAGIALTVALTAGSLGAPQQPEAEAASSAPAVLLERRGSLLGDTSIRMLRLASEPAGTSAPWVVGWSPTWAPSGNRIAFIRSGRNGRADLLVMRFGDSRPRNVTRSKAREADPAWAPSGSRVALVRTAGGNARIVVIDVSSGDVTPVPGTTDGARPAWSPDGTKLAFTRSDGAVHQLHVAGLTQGTSEQLTSGSIHHSSPSWSPDGTRIVVRTGQHTFGGALRSIDPVLGTSEILPGTEGGHEPRWSSGGDAIYFVVRSRDGDAPRKIDPLTFQVSGLGLGRASVAAPQPCPGECVDAPFTSERRSSLSFSVTKRNRKVKVAGRLSARADRERVLVSMERKKGGRFVPFSKRWAALDRRSFEKAVPKPFKGRCRVRVAFPGGMGLGPARAGKTLDCFYLPPGVSLSSFFRVGKSSKVAGPGPLRTFAIEVERRTMIDPWAFGDAVERILYDERSWGGGGYLGMQRVGRGPASLLVTLATPATTDRLCAGYNTVGRFSCYNGSRVVINAWRWTNGSTTYNRLKNYRRYLINHEVGHGLGHHGHRACPSDGRAPPVMMQQTLKLHGCGRAPWPARWEKALTPGAARP